MSSILTNNGAMVALQTLKSINKNLVETQNQISTGKEVASAKDSSAIWSIAKTMESDVAGFKAVSDQLALGEATVGVGLAAAEQIVDRLTEMRELAVSATSDNVDHSQIQAEIDEKFAQISDIIDGAQFNGANMLLDTVDGTNASLTIATSIDRIGTGTPSLQTLTVAAQDFVTSIAGATPTSISDSATAATALGEIDALITIATDGAATLGATAERLSEQNEFVGKLMDSMKAGIGTLVDADMEEASARLQALQTQQQLGVQALSIANQAPQTILSLFR